MTEMPPGRLLIITGPIINHDSIIYEVRGVVFHPRKTIRQATTAVALMRRITNVVCLLRVQSVWAACLECRSCLGYWAKVDQWPGAPCIALRRFDCVHSSRPCWDGQRLWDSGGRARPLTTLTSLISQLVGCICARY